MRQKIGKSLASMGLAAVICLSLLPMSALAVEYLFDIKDGVLLGAKIDHNEEEFYDYMQGKGYPPAYVVIPDGVTTIGKWALDGFYAATITIPDSVTTIEDYAFQRGGGFETLTIPDSVTSIGACAFEAIQYLREVDLGRGLTTLGDSAFSTCQELESVTIPASLTDCGGAAFMYCYALKNVEIAEGATVIGDSMFYGCNALERVEIPGSVTTIGIDAFGSCSNLTEVSLGEGITRISGSAFYQCPRLTDITIPDSVTEIGWLGIDKGVTIHALSGSVAEAYAKEYGNPFVSTGARVLQEAPQADQASDWAQVSLNEAYTSGLIPPALQSQYTQATNRAEFCALAVALYETATKTEISGRTTFNDTTDVNVEKMSYLGVVNGVGGGNFAPGQSLTREQAATMLSRLADAVGKPLSAQAPTFADNASISSWAVDAVGQIQASGVMGGVGNNSFAPAGDYTREQSIVTMNRLFELVK